MVERSDKIEQGNSSQLKHSGTTIKVAARGDLDKHEGPVSPPHSKVIVNLYIGLLAVVSCAGFAAMLQVTTPLQYFSSIAEWLSLLLLAVLIIAFEWFSVNLYFEQTALSTSAIPILAAYLLFGPIGILVASLVVAVTLLLKYRSPFSRLVFNLSNHILAGTLCFALIYATGKQYLEWDVASQLPLTLAAALIMYLATTWSIAIGMRLDLKQPAQQIWKEQYGWLVSYYLGFGFITFTLVFGYIHAGNVGILLMIVPMVLLRFSQKQYIDRTKNTVVELREKNQILKKSSEEILELNESLLEILSEIIDLRDPFVLGHSKQVSYYATEIAKVMKLNDRQIELIRKGSLLHDIGKLGIPEDILKKPARLTPEEYEVMKRHAALGAQLIGKSPALRSLIPIIRHHHEFFNGQGYPDKLMGSQIPIEARIVALADAIEAMSSERHYRKALSMETVKNEIELHAGSQFDPLVVEAGLKVIEPKLETVKMEPEAQRDLVRPFVPSS
jgi:putative nucleotidyltransferase with HDIG domain